MELYWGGKQKYQERKLSCCHLIHHKFYFYRWESDCVQYSDWKLLRHSSAVHSALNMCRILTNKAVTAVTFFLRIPAQCPSREHHRWCELTVTWPWANRDRWYEEMRLKTKHICSDRELPVSEPSPLVSDVFKFRVFSLSVTGPWAVAWTDADSENIFRDRELMVRWPWANRDWSYEMLLNTKNVFPELELAFIWPWCDRGVTVSALLTSSAWIRSRPYNPNGRNQFSAVVTCSVTLQCAGAAPCW